VARACAHNRQVETDRLDRLPAWSASLTIPLATRIPPRWHSAALRTVKAVHTAAFFSIAGSILLFT